MTEQQEHVKVFIVGIDANGFCNPVEIHTEEAIVDWDVWGDWITLHHYDSKQAIRISSYSNFKTVTGII